jgi:molybdenum cofactor cytidylyltransferase
MGTKIAAVILAAGQSSRMGRPKLLLPWGGTTVLGQVAGTFAAGLSTDSLAESRIRTDLVTDYEIVVVTGAERERVEAHVEELRRTFPVQAVYTPDHAEGGMLGSVQAGLAGLGPGVDAALIGLGDQPQVREGTVRGVCAAFRETGSPLVVPSFQNRRGHPWLVARPLWEEILHLPATATPRDFLTAHAAEIVYVEAEDDSILRDLDTPEAYERQRPRAERPLVISPILCYFCRYARELAFMVEKTIIVVEDELEAAEMFAEMMRVSGFRVLKVNSSTPAMNMIAKERPSAVILDIMMPDVSGLEVMRFMRGDPQLARIPVVVVSAKSLPTDIKTGLDAGAAVYLTKPVGYLDLKDAVERVLGPQGA